MHGDVSAAARALLAAPPSERESICLQMFNEAQLAHEYTSDMGRLHPKYGNGSLMAVAYIRRLADEPSFNDLQYCECFEIVLRNLIRFNISQRHN
ncbi:DUF7742 family protein [Ruegeria arenilitoris]|uniref:DUF7742 family protein n=1 Tax=Ruegeria arenilitoris TaxID=1173585 RepID=UPI003F5CBEE6